MEKPTKRYPVEAIYYYNDLKSYVEHKLGKDINDYYNKRTKKPATNDDRYCNFWHFIADCGDIHNGGVTYVPIGYWGWETVNGKEVQTKPDDEEEMWIWEILQEFEQFAENGSLPVWVEW